MLPFTTVSIIFIYVDIVVVSLWDHTDHNILANALKSIKVKVITS